MTTENQICGNCGHEIKIREVDKRWYHYGKLRQLREDNNREGEYLQELCWQKDCHCEKPEPCKKFKPKLPTEKEAGFTPIDELFYAEGFDEPQNQSQLTKNINETFRRRKNIQSQDDKRGVKKKLDDDNQSHEAPDTLRGSSLSEKIEDLDSEGKQVIFANRLHLIDVRASVQKILERIDNEFIEHTHEERPDYCGCYICHHQEEFRNAFIEIKEIIKSEMGKKLT